MNNGEAILTAALAENQRLKIELYDAHKKLERAHAQFQEMEKIATESVYSAMIQGGKITPKPITAADAQIGEQIN
jgi:hypothetical protein